MILVTVKQLAAIQRPAHPLTGRPVNVHDAASARTPFSPNPGVAAVPVVIRRGRA